MNAFCKHKYIPIETEPQTQNITMEVKAKIILSDILKDTNYQLTQFSDKSIIDLEKSIIVRETRGRDIGQC